MKIALVRLFVLISLAAPFNFATGQSKPQDANTATAKQQSSCAGMKEDKKQKKEQKEKKDKDKSQQEQEFQRKLMGIYG